MLRKPKLAQQTPLSAKAWEEYLASHFQVQDQQPSGQCTAAREQATARDMAVPLCRKHPPPEVLLRQGTQCDWMPDPDVNDKPSISAIETLLEGLVKKMNVLASSGFDLVAAPFIKHATILQPNGNFPLNAIEWLQCAHECPQTFDC